MVFIHTEQVKHLKVTWTYHDDRIIDKVIFLDESELPLQRTVIQPKGLRYSLGIEPIEFAFSLYRSYSLQKSLEKTCLKNL